MARCKDNIKMDLKEIRREGVGWILVARIGSGSRLF
jgi:hypothetical protein